MSGDIKDMAEKIRPVKTVAISTLGCKSNQYDSSALEDMLKGRDLSITPFPGPADAYIINTCTVTGKTDHQSRQLIRKARKTNPGAVVIVTGCYAQVSPGEVSGIEGVDYILGNAEKEKVIECIDRGKRGGGRLGGVRVMVGPESGTPFSLRSVSSSGRTRANLKIQEGCDRSCTYCIIPRARGISRSLPVADAAREIEALVAGGYKEIVLTGIHLGDYGADSRADGGLVSMLKLIEKNDYPCRFRVSSLDPDEVTGELAEVMSTAKRICPHIHLAIQSGDDNVIRLMKRGYTSRTISKKVMKLVTMVPGISIGMDVIAGFPGEGKSEFENTYRLIEDLPASYLHIFPFSKRPGTPASKFKGQVPDREIKERCLRLKRLDEAKRMGFYSKFEGKRSYVLIESSRDKKTGLLKGRTGNYIPVSLEGPGDLRAEMIELRLHAPAVTGMRGEPA